MTSSSYLGEFFLRFYLASQAEDVIVVVSHHVGEIFKFLAFNILFSSNRYILVKIKNSGRNNARTIIRIIMIKFSYLSI